MASALEGWRLLGRPDCHLCEEFLEELTAAFPSMRLVMEDVDSREDWRARYGGMIPVLLDSTGALICKVHFDAAAVHAADFPR